MPPLTKFRNRFLDALEERFFGGRKEKRNRFILLLLTALLLTLLIIPSQHFMAIRYQAGDIATSDIRATQDYLLEDRPLTEKNAPRPRLLPRMSIRTTQTPPWK